MANVQPRTLSGFMELLPAPAGTVRPDGGDPAGDLLPLRLHPPGHPGHRGQPRCCWPRAAARRRSRSTAFIKGDTDLALRFDLTVPLAKYVALHYGELTFPFRRFQIGKVYRGERAQRGRFREFYQADIDVIGDGAPGHHQRGGDPLHHLSRPSPPWACSRFQIRVNNRKILNGFYAMLGLSEQSGDIMRTVDKLDKIGPDKVPSHADRRVRPSPGRRRDEILSFTSILAPTTRS